MGGARVAGPQAERVGEHEERVGRDDGDGDARVLRRARHVARESVLVLFFAEQVRRPARTKLC